MTTNKPTDKQLLSRALWLAFKASSPAGMGFLHADTANQQTEETLFADSNEGRSVISTDYVMGRMMKTDFRVVDGKLQIRPEVPRPDYQSWGREYPTAANLIAAVELSFEK